MVYHVTNRFSKKAKNLPLKFGYFHFSEFNILAADFCASQAYSTYIIDW